MSISVSFSDKLIRRIVHRNKLRRGLGLLNEKEALLRLRIVNWTGIAPGVIKGRLLVVI